MTERLLISFYAPASTVATWTVPRRCRVLSSTLVHQTCGTVGQTSTAFLRLTGADVSGVTDGRSINASDLDTTEATKDQVCTSYVEGGPVLEVNQTVTLSNTATSVTKSRAHMWVEFF